jgi:NAD+ synthase (glutamine-hydrolysing)
VQRIRLGAAALNQTPLDWDGNRDRIAAACAEARRQEVAILCCPELCVSGYGCEDAFPAAGVLETAAAVLLELEEASRGLILAVGLPVRWESGVYDATALLVDGQLAGLVAKQHLAGEGLHYEPRWFRRWPAGRRRQVRIAGREVPFGDLRFSCGGVRIGFEICEDAWSADRPGGRLAARGIDVILNPSASHFAFGKEKIRQRFVLEGARAYATAYVYANLLGNEAGRIVYDGSTLIASPAGLIAAGRRFCFADLVVTSGVVDLDAIRLAQSRFLQPGTLVPDDDVVACDFTPSLIAPESPVLPVDRRDAWESQPEGRHSIKEEEFTRAVSLGLIDSLRKSRSSGFVVSASGGADSSAVIALVAIGVRLVVGEYGAAAAERLGIEAGAVSEQTPADPEQLTRQLVAQLLTCVYQATAYSGSVTREAARGMAIAVGARYHEFDVDPLVQAYIKLAEEAIGRLLDWRQDDLALQNIQARVRAPSVWLLANLKNALLVATSNRSEAAVGYATMDGDTAGGIAPIAGIDKAFLRDWLVWLERQGPDGLGVLPAVAAVNTQQPTAELRPPSAGQTDETDLMPYEILDRIERYAIRDRQMPLEIWQQLRADLPGESAGRLAVWTERFFQLWARNQWKRERFAPSFHLDDESLDPRAWYRFPILSGGFARELRQLRDAAAAECPEA